MSSIKAAKAPLSRSATTLNHVWLCSMALIVKLSLIRKVDNENPRLLDQRRAYKRLSLEGHAQVQN